MKYIKLFEDFISNKPKPKIVMYYDKGVSVDTASIWSNFFREYFAIEPHEMRSDEFDYKDFKNADLIVIPGGSSELEITAMTDSGKEGLKKFVNDGGKVLGVCAGAILISECYDWSLGIIKAHHNKDFHEHIQNKTAFLNFKFENAGKEVFSTLLDEVNLYYHWGPVFVSADSSCEVLLRFNSEVPRESKESESSIDKIASIYSAYGKGHALAISPHIEKSEKVKYLLANAINYLLNK